MKSAAVSGEANRRSIYALVLSFAISIPENSDTNERLKTAMPGASLSGVYSSTGTLDSIAESSSKITMGNPSPNARLIGSLTISFAFRDENASIFTVPCPPLRQNR